MRKRPVKSNNRLNASKKRRRTIDPATRQLVLQILGGVGLFAIVLLMLTGIWYGSRVSALTLETITVEGGQTISHAKVREVVANNLVGNYFGLIPKRFAWTYPQSMAVASVSNISRVKNPVIERVSGTELRVTIDEYIPFALWCKKEETPLCYFIDREGVAFAPAPFLDGGSMYRFYTFSDEPEIKKELRNREALGEIIATAEALEREFDLPISKIELDVVGDVFFHVVGGGEIKTTTDQPSEKIIENLALVLSTDDFADLTAGTFLYIDLRFGSKVFVNDTLPALASSIDEIATSSIAGNEGVNILDTVVHETVSVMTMDDEVDDSEVEITEAEEGVSESTETTATSTGTSDVE